MKSISTKSREFNGLHNRPSENTIGRSIEKFQMTGSMGDQKNYKYVRCVNGDNNFRNG